MSNSRMVAVIWEGDEAGIKTICKSFSCFQKLRHKTGNKWIEKASPSVALSYCEICGKREVDDD